MFDDLANDLSELNKDFSPDFYITRFNDLIIGTLEIWNTGISVDPTLFRER